jgi:hypothetical protein
MSRTVQPAGKRGSLKWLQVCINNRPDLLDATILRGISADTISWRSPLLADDFAEYRDANFLELLGLSHLNKKLEGFWPKRGPQWDALGVSNKGDVLLIEAKAHIAELYSPPTAAGETSARKIQIALDETAQHFGVPADIQWNKHFYQLTNRLAHLYFLRKHGIPAWLVLISFVGDEDMRGPKEASIWDAEYEKAYKTLGFTSDAPLLKHVLHVHPHVRNFA